MLVAGDVYRPAAIDQLVILGEQVLHSDCQLKCQCTFFSFLHPLIVS